MMSRWMRAAALLAMVPGAALAFEAVDTIPWPSAGRFPAYGAEIARPWTVWAYSGILHDRNILRLQFDERVDTIVRAGAGIRGEALIYGRQRLLLEAAGEYNEYWNFNQLDHFAYGVRGEWLWELGNSLSGTAGYARRQRLADIAELQRATKDLIVEDRLHAAGGWRFAADWRLTGGAEYVHLNHSATRTIPTTEEITYRAGIDYVTPLGNALGVEGRRSHGDAPISPEVGLGDFPNNEYDETELAVRFSYGLGTTLRAAGRIGHTNRTYNQLSGRDFSGTTGRGLVEWLTTPKTSLVLEAYKEPTGIIDADALYVVRKGFAFGPSWAPTIKLVFSARFVNERRVYQGDPAVELAGAPLRDENVRLLRLAAGWEPERRWQVSGAVERGERESNIFGRNYTYTAFMANLRFTY